MRRAILDFAKVLRANGIRISTDEVLCAFTGMDHIRLERREQFRALLKSSWIKRAEEIEEFDRLFDLFFGAPSASMEALLAPPVRRPDLLERIRKILDESNGLFSPEFRQLVLQGLGSAVAALPEAAQAAGLPRIRYPLQANHFAHRIRRRLGADRFEEQAEHLLDRLARDGVDEADLEELERELAARTETLYGLIREQTGRWAEASRKRQESRPVPRDLLTKGFGALSALEIEVMRKAVDELVKKIRDEVSLRRRRRRRGRFDLKQTLRRSMAYGGIPLEITLRQRKRSKARIAALCDVSRSVWNASRFMLHLLYSLQDQFDKVRSFVFVDQLGEVTPFFDRRDVNEAIETALNEAPIPYNRYTDYGNVFKQFQEEFAEAVNRKTTFIVIGDGRNNEFDPGARYLERIRSRARRMIWLNPEPRGFWNFGDSIMDLYGTYFDEVRECRNLKQLLAFVEDLAL